jgi:hypothetical protein
LQQALGTDMKRPSQTTYPTAAALWNLGARSILGQKANTYREVLPLYLRAAAAQERRK